MRVINKVNQEVVASFVNTNRAIEEDLPEGTITVSIESDEDSCWVKLKPSDGICYASDSCGSTFFSTLTDGSLCIGIRKKKK